MYFLRRRSVKKSDEGLYECQISTEPKMSYYIHLNVVGKQLYKSLQLFSTGTQNLAVIVRKQN